MAGIPSLDCSLDENGLVGSIPICQSTPQKKDIAKRKQNETKKQTKPELSCQYCGKKYVVRHYLLLHIKGHEKALHVSAPDDNNNNNSQQIVHLDISDVSLSHLTSDVNLSSATGTFKVPAPVPAKKKVTNIKSKKKPCLICTYCRREYVCSRSFKSHIRTHLIEHAASRFPDTEKIIKNSQEIGMKALNLVSNGPCLGEAASEFREIIGYVVSISSTVEFEKFNTDICTYMTKGIGRVKYLLPSALVNCLMDDQEEILSDSDLCDTFLQIINVNEQFSEDVCAQFFLKFILYFTTELLQYVSRTFKSDHPFRAGCTVIGEPDQEDRQVIYYIAGSIMRSYLKMGKRFPKNSTWLKVVNALKSKMIVDKAEGDQIPDAQWTIEVDRGALLYINTKSQDLFVKLAIVIYSHEKHDGSIEFKAVIRQVLKSELIVDWDNIICGSLSETVSLNLLSDIVQYFSRTCGRGIAKRRLNFIRQRPVASMTTRHLVASRKNR